MKHIVWTAAGIFALSFTPAHSQTNSNFLDALAGGSATLDLRYRFEHVDQENISRDAEASTLRTRLGYRTGEFKSFSGFLEFHDTREAFADNFNDTVNGKTRFPVVADPDMTELNQAWLRYSVTDTNSWLGRRRITRDNHRWIGNVGWRQKEQTYDSFSLASSFLPDTRFHYDYLWQINRIFGDESAMGEWDSDSHLAHISHDAWPWLTVTGYAWLLDFEDDAPGASSNTLGLRFEGKQTINRVVVGYNLEYARQKDAHDNPGNYHLSYGLAELEIPVYGVTIKPAWEILEGDGENAVQTPLATLHAHNGWADIFLTTPPDGLVDRSLAVSGSPWERISLAASFHDYRSDRSSRDYGTEWNLLATWAATDDLTLGAKYADYNEKGFAQDTRKGWLFAEYGFDQR
ncbi:alginate export family protein [Marinobacter sp.]|uniref:alginate export family protein n=1 Tax=Marinobacter sp. TaxID=50741 RepID=UPI00384FBEC8